VAGQSAATDLFLDVFWRDSVIDSNVQQVERWFAQTESRISELFPETHFHVLDGADRIRGKANIQINGPLVGASISFWNKGDVQALVLDKAHGKTIAIDDRVLTMDDNISSLLRSYLEKLMSLLKDLEDK
jgi:hypothetical protein